MKIPKINQNLFLRKSEDLKLAKFGGCGRNKKMAESGDGMPSSKVWGYFGGQSGENPEGGGSCG
jgi:hypothetical protein